MDDDKYGKLPIPTYEEAISSRPGSSQNYRGPEEVSDDAERQGLLEQGDGGGGRHRPPTVESPRSSEDSDLRLPEVGDDPRRQIEELDYLDPSSDEASQRRGLYHRARLRSQFSKHLANISATFSSIRIPSLRYFYHPVAAADEGDETTTAANNNEPPPRWPHRLSIPPQYRISAPTFARLAALFTIAAMIYALFALDIFPNNPRQMGSHFDPESVRQFVQEHVDGDSIARYLHHITSYDHVAGTEGDLYLVKWMQERWVEGDGGGLGNSRGFDSVELEKYFVYLNYPTKGGRGVEIVEPEGKRWEAVLEEKQMDDEKEQSWSWHGHSFSGEARGHLVYANGGSREDFQWLRENGVELKGAIALVREYGTQSDTGLKVKAAEEAGCAGVLIYEPVGRGNIWPDGPWRPADSVQRGAVSYGSWVIGDPLTPGWASKKKVDRLSIKDNPGLPGIPSLPLSWRDATVLIGALEGQGVKVPTEWLGGHDGKNGWFSGTSKGKTAPIINLRNNIDVSKKQQIWNLHGLIQGIESPEKKLIVGNHRDSWCFGAVDPGSGSAIMMEVVSIFQSLRRLGWRPCERSNFTEYVEDNIGYLRDNGIAYLNVDAGVYGEEFHAAASPLFKKALMHVMNRVADPRDNTTLRQLWDEEGAELEDPAKRRSDALPFLSMAGTSSIDFGFRGDAGYPEGSCYDTFKWMQKFGDTGFAYHQTLAQVWALLILEIADRPLIPFNLNAYANAIHLYIKTLQQDAQKTYSRLNSGAVVDNPTHLTQLTSNIFTLAPLKAAADNLTKNVHAFHHFEDTWTTNVLGAGGLESSSFAIQRLQYNDKIAHFESDLLDLAYEHGDEGEHGVPGREQFRHVVFGPSACGGGDGDGAGVVAFPAVRDAVERGDWEGAMGMVGRVAGVLERAGRKLGE
ncbi:hypothetical protein LTR37_014275 [Vermiconidia calcicola]|uniref:Uncharacterized protein n=1 Tax=Vermiconidia calcicola TaxID=1690605 RepID=A0ACC3MUL7_9PEZI|nr:hypothetical protein LTR37_014275 [Vermiconidia calcicola]